MMNHHHSSASETDESSQASSSSRALILSQPPPEHHHAKKLNFESLGVHGRDKESSILNACFDQMLTGNVERQLILISGTSGSGKSKLAKVLKSPTEKCYGLFVVGKFENACRREPYSGIASACEEICHAILDLASKSTVGFNMICNQIKNELGSELYLLFHVIPLLEKIFRVIPAQEQQMKGQQPQREDNVALVQGSLPSSSANSKNRFHFALLRFMRVMSSEFEPLVVVIDDLQWADASSLELIEMMASDCGNPKLLIIGTYRSNEVDATHVLNRDLQDWRARSTEKDIVLTEIELNNLGPDSVHKIILRLLSCESSERTLGLAQVCYQKTLGNAFYLMQFLSMLSDKNLLRFGVNGFSWTWDEGEIIESTNASDNVFDLLKAKISSLNAKPLEILKLAAYLGSTFELRMLDLVWKRVSHDVTEGSSDETLVAAFEALENDGFLIRISKVALRYGWAHDKVKEAVLSLISKAEQLKMGRRIGEIMVSALHGIEELDSPLFVAVNLMNAGSNPMDMGNDARLKLARLNAMASQKAISMSAFESASTYAAAGICFLPENAWKLHYKLTLQLYSIGAKANGFIGNVETLELYCKEVTSQQDKPIEDMLDVYNAWIDSISNRLMNQAAIDLALEILGKFKCHFPTSMIGVGVETVINLRQIKATMKSRDASKLKKLEDNTRIELMELLNKVGKCMYMSGDSRMPIVMFRTLNWSMKYGYCDYSSVAFACTGMILTGILNEFQGGARYGEQALTLLEKSKSINNASRTIFLVHFFLFSWTKPLKSLLTPLLHAYDVGLQSGDTEHGTYAVMAWLDMKFIMGSSLDTLEPAAEMYLKQMKAWKRDWALFCTKCMRQASLNLMGRNNLDNPTSMIGDALSKEDVEYCQNGDFFIQVALHFYQSFLCTTYGEHICNADLAIKFGHDYIAKKQPASPRSMGDALAKGISCFAAARETGKKEYSKIAKLLHIKIQRWADAGNPNIKHCMSFLDAEAMALKGQPSHKVIKQYEIAISQAVHGGYKHNAALACERLGEYHLSLLPVADWKKARKYFAHASKYWKSWGAMGKVHDLERKYSNLIRLPEKDLVDSSDIKILEEME